MITVQAMTENEFDENTMVRDFDPWCLLLVVTCIIDAVEDDQREQAQQAEKIRREQAAQAARVAEKQAYLDQC